MLPARGIARFLEVHTEIDQVCQNLDLTHRLHVSSHDSKRQPWFSIFHHEPRDDGMKWAFARRVDVWVARLHRKKLAAIRESESEAGNHNPGTHAAKIALNERDHIS